jgi:hypothetical protein
MLIICIHFVLLIKSGSMEGEEEEEDQMWMEQTHMEGEED